MHGLRFVYEEGMKNRFEVWVTFQFEPGADCLYCGDVPKVGSLLNGSEVRLVVSQPKNSNQFLAVLAR
jgi:hypothetical protein